MDKSYLGEQQQQQQQRALAPIFHLYSESLILVYDVHMMWVARSISTSIGLPGMYPESTGISRTTAVPGTWYLVGHMIRTYHCYEYLVLPYHAILPLPFVAFYRTAPCPGHSGTEKLVRSIYLFIQFFFFSWKI